MGSLYVVRFVRNDNNPNEEYVYTTQEEAKRHRELFIDDDSGLYECIELLDFDSSEHMCKAIEFKR